jgi:hypothetical protein
MHSLINLVFYHEKLIYSYEAFDGMAIATQFRARDAIPKLGIIKDEISRVKEKVQFFIAEIDANHFNVDYDTSNMRHLAVEVNAKLLPNFKVVKIALQSLAGEQQLLDLEESIVAFFNEFAHELAVREPRLRAAWQKPEYLVLTDDFKSYCKDIVRSIDKINELFARIIVRLSAVAQKNNAA